MASIPSTHHGDSPEKKKEKLTESHGVLQKFYLGGNWQLYSKQLEEYFTKNNIPDVEQVPVLLTVLSPPVYHVLRNACHPELPQLKTYAQLSNVLETHSLQGSLVFKERIKFHEAKQVDNESVNDWLARVMSFASFCEFDKQLDHMVRDKFVSGLADQRIVRRLCEENSKGMLSIRDMVDIAVEMDNFVERQNEEKPSVAKQQKQLERTRVINILDIPDEILIKIILHLNARHRVPLGNSCQRFNNLVFRDQELLRDLDFSENGHMTSVFDIQKYFNDESTRMHIRRLNLRNVMCIQPGNMLNDTIGKALNLVDIHMHGIMFENAWLLGSFLDPLIHVRKLSIDWQIMEGIHHSSFCGKYLEKPFSRLTYFSVILEFGCLEAFLISVQLCQKLKWLCIEIGSNNGTDYYDLGRDELRKLQNLEIVEYVGIWATDAKERIVNILPDPEKWTDFFMEDCISSDDDDSHLRSIYLEKNLEVCKELKGGEWMQNVPDDQWNLLNLGWALFPECLLNEVLKITHENVPEKFCCLSTFRVADHRLLLNTDDAKRLVKNPKHQISYLSIKHDIERGCDAHLIASAFPNITQLELTNIIKNYDDLPQNIPHPERYLRRKGGSVSEKQDISRNLDSSFKMFIEHTPHVKDLTMIGSFIGEVGWCWDLDALNLISGWKNLEALSLSYVPIRSGAFLIEIGKECQNLQRLWLIALGSQQTWCYKYDFFQMRQFCRNLREILIEQDNIDHISEVITWLSSNIKLKRVTIKTTAAKDTIPELVTSMKQLLRRCSDLSSLLCEMKFTTPTDYDDLAAAVQTLIGEYRCRNLQIQITYRMPDHSTMEIGAVDEDTHSPLSYSSYANHRPSFP